MKKNRLQFVLAVVAGLLAVMSGCTTLDVGKAPVLEQHASWGVLPFVNHTETPQAGLRAEMIAESLLRSRTGMEIRRYPEKLNNESLFEPATRKQTEAALEWARTENLRYALGGSVEEWRYKVGIDGEPAVGITLQLIDVASGNVLWSATGGGTGWSRSALSAVAQKLMRQLLAPLAGAIR
jgi:polysaccharide biosynthesis protein PelC